jgi:macrolide-specific efflux system membrane fusion protein
VSSEPSPSPPDAPASPLPLMEAGGGPDGGDVPASPSASASDDAPTSGGVRRFLHPRVIVPIVLVVAFAVWWFGVRSDGGSSTAAATTTSTIATVTRGSMSQSVSSEGTVAAAQSSDLSFPSSGTVTAVNVKVGDAVTAGEVLATIDSAQLQSSVSAAQASVADAEAKLADDQASGASDAQISADQASVTSANDSLTNAQQALAGASLVATFDGTVSEVNVTVGEQLSSGGTGGTSATGSASGSGRSSASIGSSSGGFGASAASSSSSSSSSSSAQIEVVSKGHYTVSLSVGSNDIDGVAVGQPVTVTLSTSSAANGFPGGGFGGGRFGGRVGANANTGAAAATGTGTGGSGTGSTAAGGATNAATANGTVTDVAKVASASSGVATYPVTVTFTNDANDFYVGSTVTAAIITNTRDNVLEVPTLALTSVGGSPAVTVATDGTVSGHTETVPVKTGLTANGMVEITDGLKAGQKLIVSLPVFGGTGTGSSTTGRGTVNGGGQFPGGGRFGGGAAQTSGGTGQ